MVLLLKLVFLNALELVLNGMELNSVEERWVCIQHNIIQHMVFKNVIYLGLI